MSNPCIGDLYKYAALSTASYVRMGGLPELLRTDGGRFAGEAQSQGRIPISLATALFDPADSAAQRWNILGYYGSDAPEFAQDNSGFAATLFQDSISSEKVLAIRGTEPTEDKVIDIGISLLPLGVDLISADLGQIGMFGLALTQVVSMANYVMRLKGSTGDLVPQLKVEALLMQPSGPYIEMQGVAGTTVYLSFRSAGLATGLDKLRLGETIKVTGHSLG